MESGKQLPAWARRLHQELTASDARAAALVKPLTPEQLNWKPAPEKWSVGQCLEHLAISTEVYLGPIADALAGPPLGAVTYDPGLVRQGGSSAITLRRRP